MTLRCRRPWPRGWPISAAGLVLLVLVLPGLEVWL